MTFCLTEFQRQIRAEIKRLTAILDATMQRPADIRWKAILPCPGRRGIMKGTKLGPRKHSKTTEAIAWLREYMGDGKPHAAGKVIAAAEKAGFGRPTFNIASRRAGVTKWKTAPDKPWVWKLD